MADIKNYTLNFGFGRPAAPALTCASRRSAFAEIQRGWLTAAGCANG
ncbi:MAG: hypothetical protein M9907_06095 [Burkholderiaceae bacterium]|nr:hypothetical protein [Burkholderiaceae bacterium]